MFQRGLIIVALMFALTGCAGGKSWSEGKKIPTPAASDGGFYSLYVDKQKTPIWSGRLEKGDKYGFRKAPFGGGVVAFTETYGDIQISPDSTYMWKKGAASD